jgi:hypothetical protein
MNIPSSDVKSIGRRSEKETKKLNKRSPFSKSKKQFKGLGGGYKNTTCEGDCDG